MTRLGIPINGEAVVAGAESRTHLADVLPSQRFSNRHPYLGCEHGAMRSPVPDTRGCRGGPPPLDVNDPVAFVYHYAVAQELTPASVMAHDPTCRDQRAHENLQTYSVSRRRSTGACLAKRERQT